MMGLDPLQPMAVAEMTCSFNELWQQEPELVHSCLIRLIRDDRTDLMDLPIPMELDPVTVRDYLVACLFNILSIQYPDCFKPPSHRDRGPCAASSRHA